MGRRFFEIRPNDKPKEGHFAVLKYTFEIEVIFDIYVGGVGLGE